MKSANNRNSITFKKKPIKQHIIVLPITFQEEVILREIKFDEGNRGIELIRELLYLYAVTYY